MLQIKSEGPQLKQLLQIRGEGDHPLELPELQPQVKASSSETQLVQSPKAGVAMKQPLPMLQLLLKGSAEGMQPMQVYQLQPQTKTDGMQSLELLQLQPQTKPPEGLQARNAGKLQEGQKSVHEACQSAQPLLLQPVSAGMTGTHPLKLIPLHPPVSGNQQVLAISSLTGTAVSPAEGSQPASTVAGTTKHPYPWSSVFTPDQG